MAFTEPDIIWRADRSYGESTEELRLERSEWQGKQVYRLRVVWKTPDGQFRFCAAKPSTTGRFWQEFNLKARELAELGAALIAEAQDLQPPIDPNTPLPAARGQQAAPRQAGQDGQHRRAQSTKEQRETQRYDAGVQSRQNPRQAPRPAADEDDLPF